MPTRQGLGPPLFAWAGSAYAAPRRIHSPQGHGQKRARAPRPERPRLLPSSIQQPRRQPRAPLEPLGSSGGFLSLKQCCCVTHMRFPAMLCNGKMAEEKKRASRGQSRSAAEPGGAARRLRRANWCRGARRRGPPPARRRHRNRRNAAMSPGRGRATPKPPFVSCGADSGILLEADRLGVSREKGLESR